jgi:hypothetical protein
MKAGLRFWNLVAGLTLVAAPVLAAEKAQGGSRPKPVSGGPLKPGKSAGVQRAQQSHAGLALIGAGGVIAVVLVATQGGGGGSSPQPNLQSVPVTTAP